MEALLKTCGEVQASGPKWCFASDNTGGMHEDVMRSITLTNALPAAAPYGEDAVTFAASKLVRETLGYAEDDHVKFVTTGTGGNVLALSLLCQRTVHSIIAARSAHVYTHTAGVAEKIISSKIIPIQADKITTTLLESTVAHHNLMPQVFTTPKAMTLTLLTEKGEVYSLKELEELYTVAKKHNIYVHIDGARLSNACVVLAEREGITALEVARKVAEYSDALTFGGAKNGLGTSEAVIIKRHVEENENLIFATAKQANVIVSKARFVSCQFLAFFSGSLWVRNATIANNAAQTLYSVLKKHNAEVPSPPVANMMVVRVTKAIFDHVTKFYAVYGVPDGDHMNVRVVTSFESTEDDCKRFAELMSGL